MQKVAVYCRVSTDKEDQINSLENQKKYFTEYIEKNPSYKLTKIYVDEGVTGTSTKKRHSFCEMMKDAQNHTFDFILTKEISRFARNTLDSILYTRKLKALGIGVIFMNDNINTLDADAELRLTIMSSIAQEESRKTSDRVKWGQKRRMEQGVVFGRDMLGYDVRNGMLYINEEGANTVRLIFHKFVNEGKGTHIIARELQEEGILTASHMKQWTNVSVLRILKNEKYCGDLIQKKTYTPNYLNHEKKYNNGEEEFVIIENHHEPIISKSMFESANKELKKRSQMVTQNKKYSNRYCFSGKLKCGVCGSSYVSHTKKRKDGSVNKTWRCYQAVKFGMKHRNIHNDLIGCDCKTIREEDLKLVLKKVVSELSFDKKTMINSLITIIKSILMKDEPENTLENLTFKKEQVALKKSRLLELYLNEDITKLEFEGAYTKFQKVEDLINQELYELTKRNNRNKENTDVSSNQQLENMINIMNGLIDGEVWEDAFYRNLLEKIVIYDQNSMEVYLYLKRVITITIQR